ncbi:MAG: carboxypeptidase-like regulatory domain-containing protein [Acidobacteria bacterium]|nr:carboxypeptidase-like regulatory domain-containing protein [Acidobacteriota bacterium]
MKSLTCLTIFVPLLCTLLSPDASARAQVAISGGTSEARGAEEVRPKGMITGRVIDADGQPVEGATVIAIAQRAQRPNPNSSGADGRFTLSNLEPGSYTLDAHAPGYVLESALGTNSAAARKFYRDGDTATLRLTKGGVITGKVTNASGEPIVGVRVRAVRVRYLDGRPVGDDRRPFNRPTERSTDDRGVYRIYGLAPGIYVVAAGSRGWNSFQPTAYDADAQTFYPSTTRDAASEITVQSGQEMSDIDIRYRGEQGHAISGTLDFPTAAQSNSSGGDDSFAASLRRVAVRGGDVTGLKLTFAPLASIAGRVVIEALKESEPKPECKPPRPTLPEEIVIIAQRDDPKATAGSQPSRASFLTSSQSAPGSNGEFRLRGLDAARYRLDVRLPGAELFIRSINLPAASAQAAATPARAANANAPARDSLSLMAGAHVADLTITLAPGAASLSGRVGPATEGATLPATVHVYLVPSETERADDALRYAESAVAADGTFAFTNLAPGRYWLHTTNTAGDTRATAATATRPLAWDAQTRAKLRREAEARKVSVELQPCQRVEDFVLKLSLNPGQ